MMRCDFNIQVNESLNQDEKDLVLKYWEINQQANKFNFRTADLQKKTRKSISEFISTNSHVFFSDLICPTCNAPHKFHTRSHVKDFEEYKDKICMKCFAIEKERKIEINFEKFLEVDSKLNFDFSLQYDELTYLESVILLAIIDGFEGDKLLTVRGFNGGVKFLSYNFYVLVTHDQNLNHQILQNLSSKNFLLNFSYGAPGLIGEYFNIYNELITDSVFLKDDWRSKIQEIRMSKPDLGLYLVFPIGLSENDYREILMKNISRSQLTHEDLKEIDFLIKKSLVAKALLIIPRLEKLHNILVKKDLALENVIEVGVMTFDMFAFINILEYVAKITAADFNKLKFSRYDKYLIFNRNLHARLNYLIKNSRPQEYFSKVPDYIDYSLIEVFVNFYIFNESMGWDSMSGKEIINKWVSSYEDTN